MKCNETVSVLKAKTKKREWFKTNKKGTKTIKIENILIELKTIKIRQMEIKMKIPKKKGIQSAFKTIFNKQKLIENEKDVRIELWKSIGFAV